MQTPPKYPDGFVPAPHAVQRSAESTSPSSQRGGQAGAVRIARRVLRMVVEQAALSVPGVAHLAATRSGWPAWLARAAPAQGVNLNVHGEAVGVDLYIVIEPGISLTQVGSDVQDAVGEAVEHILGMKVSEINVYIRDVA